LQICPHLTLNYPNHLLIYPIQPTHPNMFAAFKNCHLQKKYTFIHNFAVCRVVVNLTKFRLLSESTKKQRISGKHIASNMLTTNLI
jgi:hypothetical protein